MYVWKTENLRSSSSETESDEVVDDDEMNGAAPEVLEPAGSIEIELEALNMDDPVHEAYFVNKFCLPVIQNDEFTRLGRVLKKGVLNEDNADVLLPKCMFCVCVRFVCVEFLLFRH